MSERRPDPRGESLCICMKLRLRSRPIPAKVAEKDRASSQTALSPDPSDLFGFGADNFVNDAVSYWSSFGHCESDNQHQSSFMDTLLPQLPPTLSPTYNFSAPVELNQTSTSRNPLLRLEQWTLEWCQKNGGWHYCLSDRPASPL